TARVRRHRPDRPPHRVRPAPHHRGGARRRAPRRRRRHLGDGPRPPPPPVGAHPTLDARRVPAPNGGQPWLTPPPRPPPPPSSCAASSSATAPGPPRCGPS